VFINAWIAIYVYLAVYGILHGGEGPSGHVADQGDLALMNTDSLGSELAK